MILSSEIPVSLVGFKDNVKMGAACGFYTYYVTKGKGNTLAQPPFLKHRNPVLDHKLTIGIFFAFPVAHSFYWSHPTMDALNQCSFIAEVCSTYEQE